MKNKNISKVFIGLLALLVVIGPLTAYAVPNPSEQLQQIENRIDENQDKLNQVRSHQHTLKSELSSFDQSISTTNVSISSLNNDIIKSQSEITRLVAEITKAENQILSEKKNLKQLIQLLYEQEKVSSFELLASSSSITEVMDAEDYNRAIEDKVNSTLGEVKKLRDQLNNQKKQQLDVQAQLDAKKAELVAQQNALLEQRNQKNQLLAVTQGDEAKYAAILKDLEVQREKAEAAIWGNGSGNYVNLGHVNQGDIIGYQGNSGYSTGSHLHFEIRTPSGEAKNPALYVGNGTWGHPLPGARVTCGWYCYPNHKGIDYAKSYGAPILATADGTIVARVTGRGNTYPYSYEYGNYVKIRHDNGWFSLYGHLK